MPIVGSPSVKILFKFLLTTLINLYCNYQSENFSKLPEFFPLVPSPPGFSLAISIPPPFTPDNRRSILVRIVSFRKERRLTECSCSQLRRDVDGELPVGDRGSRERSIEGQQRGGSDVAGGGENGDSSPSSEAEGTGASDARLAEDPEIAGNLYLSLSRSPYRYLGTGARKEDVSVITNRLPLRRDVCPLIKPII